MGSFTLEPRGPFTLASAARFIAGWPPGQGDVDDDQVQLRFLVDDWSGPAHVILRQDDGVVRGSVAADNEERAIAQAARIVSLDHDGTGYAEVGERDPIVGELQKSSGYLRPVLFHSPYEAAAWSIISARTRHAQAVKVRDALSRDGIFPAPERLLALRAQLGAAGGQTAAAARGRGGGAGGPARSRAAARGRAGRRRSTQLQELPGIGPFYAGLILLRAVGTTDVLAAGEPRLKKAVEKRYGKPLESVAEGWRPFRTWVSVLDAQRMPELYVQRDQPPGVPPLHLTGERTLPDVPEENYWFQRHLVVYEWIANRVHGRRVVDLASGEGYGAAVLARTAHVGDRRRRQPRGLRARRRQVPEVTFERNMVELWQGDVDCVVFLQTIEHIQDPDAMLAHVRDLVGARRRRLRLDAQRAHARAEGRRALRQPVARARVQAG